LSRLPRRRRGGCRCSGGEGKHSRLHRRAIQPPCRAAPHALMSRVRPRSNTVHEFAGPARYRGRSSVTLAPTQLYLRCRGIEDRNGSGGAGRHARRRVPSRRNARDPTHLRTSFIRPCNHGLRSWKAKKGSPLRQGPTGRSGGDYRTAQGDRQAPVRRNSSCIYSRLAAGRAPAHPAQVGMAWLSY
jgi:hypothetical protein